MGRGKVQVGVPPGGTDTSGTVVSHRPVPNTTLLGQSVQVAGLLSLGPTFSTNCPHLHFLEAGGTSSALSRGLWPSPVEGPAGGTESGPQQAGCPPDGCTLGLGVRTGCSPLYFWTPQVSPGAACSPDGLLRACQQGCPRLQGCWCSEGRRPWSGWSGCRAPGSHGHFLTRDWATLKFPRIWPLHPKTGDNSKIHVTRLLRGCDFRKASDTECSVTADHPQAGHAVFQTGGGMHKGVPRAAGCQPAPPQLSRSASFTPVSPRRGSPREGAASLGLPQVFQRLQDPAGRLVSSPCRTLPTLYHRHPDYTSGPAAPSSQRWTWQEGMLCCGSQDAPCAPKMELASSLPACRPVKAAACCTHTGGMERPTGGASLDTLLRKLGACGLLP